MASGSHVLALPEAADALGVSVRTLQRRIKAGLLPEAHEADGTFVIAYDSINPIAEREGWIIDVRETPGRPSSEFTEMLEQLLSLGDRLTEEVSARKVAEHEVLVGVERLDRANHEIKNLHFVIEEQDAENSRLAVDLAEATKEATIAHALADDRQQKMIELTQSAEQSRLRHENELGEHRRHGAQLRAELDEVHAAMGWWSRRRFDRPR